MSGFLDTSLTVRYLIGDAPDLAERAARVVDEEEDLLVTDVVLTETAHVLRSVYQIRREIIVDHLVDLVQKRNITMFGLDKGLVLQALLYCRSLGRVSIPDALIWAAARSSDTQVVYSFDEDFPEVGLEVRRSA